MEAEELRRVQVHQISLGVCHSLAISDTSELWGESYSDPLLECEIGLASFLHL